MGNYLTDTNALSDYLQGNLTNAGMRFLASQINSTCAISVITQIEILSWRFPNSKIENAVAELIESCKIIPLSSEIVPLCVSIRKNYSIRTPDAIIAATAIVNNLELITNDKGFERIAELKILKPDHLKL